MVAQAPPPSCPGRSRSRATGSRGRTACLRPRPTPSRCLCSPRARRRLPARRGPSRLRLSRRSRRRCARTPSRSARVRLAIGRVATVRAALCSPLRVPTPSRASKPLRSRRRPRCARRLEGSHARAGSQSWCRRRRHRSFASRLRAGSWRRGSAQGPPTELHARSSLRHCRPAALAICDRRARTSNAAPASAAAHWRARSRPRERAALRRRRAVAACGSRHLLRFDQAMPRDLAERAADSCARHRRREPVFFSARF